jgi:hypothetical protein
MLGHDALWQSTRHLSPGASLSVRYICNTLGPVAGLEVMLMLNDRNAAGQPSN